MARIRTVKPEFWQHPKVTAVSRDARLLFLGLLNEADDDGRLRYSGKRLAGVLFPEDDDVSSTEVDLWTKELEREGLVLRYAVDSAPLLVVLGFTEHQKVSHPSPSRLPSPPECFANSSGNPPEDDMSPPETLRPEWNREQGTGNGMEQGGELELAVAEVSGSGLAPDNLIFLRWQESTGRSKVVFDSKRRGVVRAALKCYPVEDLIDAVRGWRHDPHNRGENERRTVYNDLELLLRDSAHIERFRDLERGEGPAPPPRMPTGTDMSLNWLEERRQEALRERSRGSGTVVVDAGDVAEDRY